ncbi:DNA polymerase (family 10) [Roseivirga ehrenbergii]|uniref:DNA polymerase IV n=1 Tax=Roseivirga ehrenbergii (strain DSM 102268 / JCM 13514 / KCTC 12282 / NCIMB 14502 / KMM 6017) TaxID=279360 RepID=A0A150XRZ5_ROSEK|nr:DNA polymerase/3'-5' exonuclease PolX [Roseivirga ehrenbergii]KYG81471.1 DNA polymerase IV [Roseivirga ehrenbergii]TCL10621.1 DNA polymerase (family 10) [Roseivirga ehrenbergii]
MDNKTILKQLKLQAALMELHDENSFKIRGYQNAVFNLDKTDIELGNLSLAELEKIDGVGKSIAANINEINQRGVSTALEEYLKNTPEGIVELLDMKGIGPKKIKVLWKELGIESGHELKEAANSGLVAKLKGFGEKTQQTIINALEFKEANANKLHYAEAEKLAEIVMAEILEIAPDIKIEVTGALRRKMEVIEVIDLIVGTDDIEIIEDALDDAENFEQVIEESGPITWRGNYKELRIPIQLSFCEKEDFVKEQFLRTGSNLHLSLEVKDKLTLKDIVRQQNFASEKEIYAAAGLAEIVPEMREGTFEIEAAKNGKLPELVEMKDLKGILHNHSTYSDGKHSLEQMAQHCKDLGYEYLGICDHSKSAFYANGLKEDRVIQQHEEIDRLNEKLAPFKIFKGIESDILYDGQLDYTDDVLATFDFIVASVHSILNMNIEKATQRLLTAIENPYTTILGHPTGRLLLRREGYPIDHKLVIDHCAKHNVVIEINANPWRLDLDWRWVHYALEQGVKLAINPDAHEMDGYQHMYYGLLAGRKGGLTADMTFNALSAEEIGKYFAERKQKIAVNG